MVPIIHRLHLRHAVEHCEICLPANVDNAREHASIFHWDECKAECSKYRPHLAGVDEAGGQSILDTLNYFGRCAPGQESLRAEEESIEKRGVDNLANGNFCGERENVGRVIEVAGEKEIPIGDDQPWSHCRAVGCVVTYHR